jgi:hypothetical protein
VDVNDLIPDALPGETVQMELLVADRLDDLARQWFEGQRRILAAAGIGGEPLPAELPWADELRAALAAHVDEISVDWVPILYRYLGGPSSRALEEGLIDAGAIQPVGLRYTGIRL